MEFKQITCKNALSVSKLPGIDYSLNPYFGCEHNCIYCYSPNVLRIDRKKWGNSIGIKRNIPLVLSKELKKLKPGIIGISTVTDPYQPIEKKAKITKFCLEELLKNDFPIIIHTKSSLIKRDIEIISNFSDVEVMISIGTFNDKHRQIFEPFSSSIKERLNVLEIFSQIGIKSSVFFGPIYPFINELEFFNILSFFNDINISEIMIDSFNLKPGILSNIELNLRNYPDLLKIFKEKIINDKDYLLIYRKIIEDFSKKYNIRVVDAF